MVSDIADVRRILEQLAAKHEKMAKDVAALQAAKQISEEKSSPAQSSSGSPPKNIHSEAAVQPSSVPVPIPRPQIPSH